MSQTPFMEHFERTFDAIVGPEVAAAVKASELKQARLTMPALQVLYCLRSKHPQTRPDALRACAQWLPTSSADDVSAFVDRLVADQLLWEMGTPTKRLVASPASIALLSRLHPAFEDPELSARIARWSGAWPASEAEVERRLRSLSARQMRYKPTWSKTCNVVMQCAAFALSCVSSRTSLVGQNRGP